MIFQNIKSFITQKTSVFVFFILVQVVTLIGIFITYNFMQEQIAIQRSYHNELRTYTVMLSDTENIEENLAETLNQCGNIQHIYTIFNENSQLVYGEYYGDINKYSGIIIGKDLSKDDITNGYKKVVLTYDSLYNNTSLEVGNFYKINGTDYEIIGFAINDYISIPFNSIKDKNIITGICITTNTEFDASEIEQFTNKLSNIFKNSEIIQPINDDKAGQSSSFKITTFMIVVLMALGIFNLSYLYIFILEQRKKQYAIFQICGCSKAKGEFIYLVEIFIISFIPFIVSAVLFKFAIVPILVVLDKFTIYSMNLSSYLFLMIAYILVMICIFLPSISKYTLKSAALQYKA